MKVDYKLMGQLADTYQKTLDLAKNISKNRYQYFDDDLRKDHIRFIKRVSRGCQEFKELTKQYPNLKSKKVLQKAPPQEKHPAITCSPRIESKRSGKLSLNNMVEESYRLACKTRTGKGGIRYLTPSPTPTLEKLKNNKSIYTEDSDSEDRPLAYFSLVNGKTEEIDLPSFKECIKGNRRIDSQSEIALEKLRKCTERLGNFEKEINGLEIFCKYNPGVVWNQDKKMLLKLGNNPNNKMSLLRAYNERQVGSSSDESKNVRGFVNKSPTYQKIKVYMPEIVEKRTNTAVPKSIDRTDSLVFNCFDSFHKAKVSANTKTNKILAKMKAERPVYLKTKANLLLKDDEKYKGRIHSFQTLGKLKKVLEKERYLNFTNNKSQIEVYTALLDYLKRCKGMPSQCQITFVEAVRELLEGGWGLSTYKIQQILKTFDHAEQIELAELVSIANDFFDTSTTFVTSEYSI